MWRRQFIKFVGAAAATWSLAAGAQQSNPIPRIGPIGAAIFGHYGDRIGRKATLIATLMLMGIATFLIAFVPLMPRLGSGAASS